MVNELDYVTLKLDIKSINNQQNYQYYVEDNNSAKSKYDESIRQEYSETELKFLKDYLIYIIECHQLIYRKLHIIENGIQAISIIFKAIPALVCCTSIYLIVKKKDIISQSAEATTCILLFYLNYIYDVSGERINIEWENLRKALYGSQWLNKPKWFRKMLSIVISFNNRPMEIKPYGLFVLNLRNYATTINATYSYYNLINNFQSN
ncbi:uncharacterized protein LOC142317525 [Lycorma delicatula]|uniref:uncharacterized protein LOC142317525 n=1 Tax=Lycorma delicatula TaxID=130591 RepID=UPI003F516412